MLGFEPPLVHKDAFLFSNIVWCKRAGGDWARWRSEPSGSECHDELHTRDQHAKLSMAKARCSHAHAHKVRTYALAQALAGTVALHADRMRVHERAASGRAFGRDAI